VGRDDDDADLARLGQKGASDFKLTHYPPRPRNFLTRPSSLLMARPDRVRVVIRPRQLVTGICQS